MKSYITIDKLEIYAFHGVLPFERQKGGLFEVSVTIEYDFIDAAKSDDIYSSIDYAELTRIVKEQMSKPANLIETVTYNIVTDIINRWPNIISGSVSVTKVNPPIPSPSPRATTIIKW